MKEKILVVLLLMLITGSFLLIINGCGTVKLEAFRLCKEHGGVKEITDDNVYCNDGEIWLL